MKPTLQLCKDLHWMAVIVFVLMWFFVSLIKLISLLQFSFMIMVFPTSLYRRLDLQTSGIS
jgi:hypothetical protein